jgi:glycosyltransferase involved in cell wall biosynthesis
MKIVISWNELPKYAAYPIAEIIKKNSKLEIISIRSKLPITKLEKILNKKIIWINDKRLSWSDLGLKIPDIYFQAGWYKKSFSSLGQEVKNNGGKVVLLSDNSYKNNIRQKIGSIIYKFKYLNHFDATWVPGYLGAKLMKSFGVPQKKIFEGLYCSNQNIFKKGIAISKRQKNFLFIGNLVKKKGVVELVSSFKLFLNSNPDWKLIIVGNGPLKKIIPKHKNIKSLRFKTPKEVSELMQKSRFLVLPTHSDQWPLVVNEATLCGCGLILTDVVGNIPELSNKKNSIICKTASVKSLTLAIDKASKLDKNKLDIMFNESLKLGSKFTVSNWKHNYYKILRRIMKKN